MADLRKIPYKNNTFAFIHCSGVFHHIPEDNKAFMEMVRVLKPNGALFIAVSGDYGFIHKFAKLIRPFTTKFKERTMISIFRLITPPATIIKSFLKILNIKIPSTH